MEVRSGLPIVKAFELLSDSHICLETLFDVALSLMVLSLFEVVTETEKGILSLLEACFTSSLIKSLLFL